MGGMLVPTRYLSVAGAYAGVVHIPLGELEQRMHELPPPHRAIRLLCDSWDTYHALGWLHARGRRARLAPAPPADADPTARYRLWEPNEWLGEVCAALESSLSPLSKGGEGGAGARFARIRRPRALDLGCGSGREAVYLAAQGWQVVAVDRLPDALERGRDLQHRYAPNSLPVQWVCVDLEKSDWQPDNGFDCITLFFLFSRELVSRACAWLNCGGMLLVEAFTETHRARFGKPASHRRVVGAGELPRLLPEGMRIVAYSEGWRTNGRHTARLWAVRISPDRFLGATLSENR